MVDCKTVGFFSKSVKKTVKRGYESYAREPREPHTPVGRVRREKKNRIFSLSPQSGCLFSASFQTFCLTARAYFNTQKYGLFLSLGLWNLKDIQNSSKNRSNNTLVHEKAVTRVHGSCLFQVMGSCFIYHLKPKKGTSFGRNLPIYAYRLRNHWE